VPTLDDIFKTKLSFPAAPGPSPAPAAPTPSAAPSAQVRSAPAAGPSPMSVSSVMSTLGALGVNPPGTAPGSPDTGRPTQCGPDERWDNTMQMCVPRSMPAAPGVCTGGEVWRTDTGRCEAPDARSRAGQETCTGAQPACPPGQAVWCDFDTATWQCAPGNFSSDELCRAGNRQRRRAGKPEIPCPGGGRGAGGRGGAGGGKGTGSTPSPGDMPSSDLAGTLLKQLLRDMAAPSRFTPEALQAMYGEIARQSSGQIERGTRAVKAEAAGRNMSRSGQVGASIAAVRAGAESQRGQATVGVQLEKIRADFADKNAALDRAQKYLDSLRDNEYRYTLLAEQRRQFDANLALAYANLAQQRQMLQMSLQSAWDMLKAQQGFLLLGQGV
jgi:hypothetical protein